MTTSTTILDVAHHAGVSRATVSLVLQDSSRIPQVTKDKVRASITALNYRYNRRAASLRSTRTMSVGLVVADVRNSYFSEFSMAVQQALQVAGYNVLVGYSLDSLVEQGEVLKSMAEYQVDGIILLPAPNTSRSYMKAALGDAGIPHVLIGRRVQGYESDFVATDNLLGSRLIGAHLRDLGISKAALLGGSAQTSAFHDRVEGLTQELGVGAVRAFSSSSSLEGGVQAAETLLDLKDDAEAIVAYTDTVALGIYEELRRRHIRPGRDVAIAAFDDSPLSRLLRPSLTTVATFPHVLGAEAVALLLSRLKEQDGPPRTVTITPALDVNRSTTDWKQTRTPTA